MGVLGLLISILIIFICFNDQIFLQRFSSPQFKTCRSFWIFDLDRKFLTDMFTTSPSLPTAVVANSSPNPCNDGDAITVTDGDLLREGKSTPSESLQSQTHEGHLFHRIITSLSHGAPPLPSPGSSQALRNLVQAQVSQWKQQMQRTEH